MLHEKFINWGIIALANQPTVPAGRNSVTGNTNGEEIICHFNPSSSGISVQLQIFIIHVSELILSNTFNKALSTTDIVGMTRSSVTSVVSTEETFPTVTSEEFRGKELIDSPSPKTLLRLDQPFFIEIFQDYHFSLMK